MIVFLSWQIILDAGVDVNLRNVHNTIPLHVALARGAKSCVGLLLSAGANCNLQVGQLYIYLSLLSILWSILLLQQKLKSFVLSRWFIKSYKIILLESCLYRFICNILEEVIKYQTNVSLANELINLGIS